MNILQRPRTKRFREYVAANISTEFEKACVSPKVLEKAMEIAADTLDTDKEMPVQTLMALVMLAFVELCERFSDEVVKNESVQ